MCDEHTIKDEQDQPSNLDAARAQHPCSRRFRGIFVSCAKHHNTPYFHRYNGQQALLSIADI